MIKVNRVTTESNLDGIGENKPLSSVSVTASTPSTGPKTTCSVKLVDIGPKISAGGSDNMHSGNARSNATGDSLKRDLLSSSGVSGGELRMAASAASLVKAASTAQPQSVEANTDEPNAKKPRPSLSESSHRIPMLKPKDFVDLKRRTATSGFGPTSGFKTGNEDSSTVNSSNKQTIDSSTFDNVEEELGRLFGSSSPHKKDNSNNKVTISPVKSSSASSLSSSSSISSIVTKDQSGFAASHRMSSKQTSGSPSSTSLTTSAASMASTASSSASSTSSLNPSSSASGGSVTITKLSTGSSLSVESKDLKSVLSAGGNRPPATQAASGPHSLQHQSVTGSTSTMSTAAGISPAISSRVGLVENGLNRLKSNIDITAMASNNSANGGSATNQVGDRGPKQPFQQQHSPGLAGGDSGAGGGSIRCNKCNVEYSTKEARRLHTCNSILDQHYLSVENAGERTSNSNKSSSPNSPTGLHMTSADRAANENSTSSPPSSFDSASSRSNSPMMDQWGAGSGGGGGSGNRKSTSSSSMTSGSGSSASNGSNSNSSNVSSNSVKLIKEKSDKLIIEGRPKLSVTKVSRLDSSTSNEGNSAKSKQGPTSSHSPALPKFKLSTASLSDSKKYNETATAEMAPSSGGGGEKHQRANVNVKATSKNNFESNNVASYSGKLKIKLGGGSTTIQSEKSQASSSDRTSDRSVNHHNQDGGAAGSGSSGGPEGDRGGLAFSFAGKPTYSPSRIEPSNSGGTTVQTKGELLFSTNVQFMSFGQGVECRNWC